MIATLDQAIEDSKKGIIDFTHEGKCSRFGQCCCSCNGVRPVCILKSNVCVKKI